jgi:hypothetical protein
VVNVVAAFAEVLSSSGSRAHLYALFDEPSQRIRVANAMISSK